MTQNDVEARSESPDIQRREDDGVYVLYHDFDEEDLTVTLSLALSEVGDVSPTELVPQFSRYADPDALDQLFRPRPNGDLRQGGPLYLDIEGYEVAVFASGRVEIRN